MFRHPATTLVLQLTAPEENMTSLESKLASIRDDVIGDNCPIPTPFGEKPLVYADYTASGRSLKSIEHYIQQEVMPWYANTHSESSFTGRQTTQLREEARRIIHNAVNGSDEDLVIFCGSGATAAIHKLIDILNLRLPADLSGRYQLHKRIPEAERPVVFIGPYEHHSNELPWRESIADLVCVPLTDCGQIDLQALELQLTRYRDRPLKIGSFSAASNVTGLKSDTAAISQLLHRHGALSFWDYAAAAPYTPINMGDGKAGSNTVSKDAVFISPHKFIGGPGTPGILVVKKHLLKNSVPAVPGGGTVSFVTPDEHRYISDDERREEGGTPAIIESIRAGLVFKLQQDVGLENIAAREHGFVRRAIERWQQNSNIEILGCSDKPRLSIVSLQIRSHGKYLHYGFVVALLNDLFGIQSRGGCSCAGPYGHQLLGIDKQTSKEIEQAVNEGQMIVRPGWVRLNFNYFIDQDCFNYILDAVDLIARYGERLLPYYQFDEASAIWRFHGKEVVLPSSLDNYSLAKNSTPTPRAPISDYQRCLALAEEELRKIRQDQPRYDVRLEGRYAHLQWFTLPQDVRAA